jgi:hypothetical protein
MLRHRRSSAWLGLWDPARYEDDPAQRDDCALRLQEISHRVPLLESGDWTRYDALQRWPASPAHHELHAVSRGDAAAPGALEFGHESAGRDTRPAGPRKETETRSPWTP